MRTTRQKAKSRDREQKRQAERRNLKHDALAALRSALRACDDHGVPHSSIVYIVEGHIGQALTTTEPSRDKQEEKEQ